MKKSRIPYLHLITILLLGLGITRFRDHQRKEAVKNAIQDEPLRSPLPARPQTPQDKNVPLNMAAGRFLKQPSDLNAPDDATATFPIDHEAKSRKAPDRVVDRLASYQELERHVAEINDHTARITRLLSTPLKYSRIRTTETVDTRTGEILSHRAESADHVIVKFQSAPSKHDFDLLLDSFGLSIRKKMQTENTYILAIPSPDLWAIDRAMEALGTLRFVEFSEPDFIILDSRKK